ncbi:MAG: hypothetical protein LBH35_01110 [Treponema sp.]|jgi:hypothetical protein|nr:hypothetical protein [Treponema sp.]
MTEKAEWAKIYALFRQLSEAHKQEILVKAEALVSAEARRIPEEEREKPGVDRNFP